MLPKPSDQTCDMATYGVSLPSAQLRLRVSEDVSSDMIIKDPWDGENAREAFRSLKEQQESIQYLQNGSFTLSLFVKTSSCEQ